MLGKACVGTMSAFYKLWTELCGRLRLRRGHGDTSEDDEGLPRSPCNSPTTADGHHNKTAKDLPTKSHSTCSDGSLLSMGSSEMDEDSYGLNSRHSSKLSLQDKRSVDQDSDIELGPSNSALPLNHSAAHHRVSVRPKRTHGAPRRKRAPPLSTALPATPEVNEDSSLRSNTPDGTTKVGPGGESKLNRSKSNGGSKSQDAFSTLDEPKEEKTEKTTFLPKWIRTSGKKKKAKEKHQEHLQYTSSTSSSMHSTEINSTTTISSSSISTKRLESKPIAAPRSSAATRQRVQPKNIPITPEEEKRDVVLRKQSPEKSLSPFDLELENRIKQRQTLISTSPPKHITPPQSPKASKSPVQMQLENVMKQRHTLLSTSPSKPPLKSPPQSPKAPRSPPVIIKSEFTQRVSRFSENYSEERHSKVKLGNLSPFHRKIISTNEDDEPDHSFKSLTELTQRETPVLKPVVKSQSFKAPKEDSTEIKATMAKAASTDSLKVIDSPPPSFDSNFMIELRTNPQQAESNHDSISSDILKDVKEITNELVAEIKDDFTPTDKSIKDKTNELIMSEIQDSLLNKEIEVFGDPSGITISGPSHTAIVNVTSTSNAIDSFKTSQLMESEDELTKTVAVKETQVSVTKIQLRHETTTTTTTTANLTETVPEFLNKQLNKVEPKPDKNVIFTMTSPKIERQRPLTLNFDSDVNMEIVEKDKEDNELPSPTEIIKPETPEEERKPLITVPLRPKKVDKSPVKTPESPKKLLDGSDRSSQESIDSGVLRKKSFVSSPKSEEPSELMKVFARRSRIYSDQDADDLPKEINNESKTRDSDKENDVESPVEERKRSVTKIEDNPEVKPEPKEPTKEPLIESSSVNPTTDNINTETVESTAEVTLRKPSLPQPRSFSLNFKNAEPIVKKPFSRPAVSYWSKSESKEKTEEIISSISQKEESINNKELTIEPKNFNQRKAEWEKRAQLAQKNNVP